VLPTSIALALLAIALAWPVPLALASAAWPARSPAVALVVWQSIALAGGLSMIGALLVFGLAPFGGNLVGALASFIDAIADGRLPRGTGFHHAFALSSAILLAVHLLLNLALAVVRDERSRRRHRQLVELLSTPDPERPATRLLDESAPIAYCLPGTSRSITVLSAGLLAMLQPDELAAVVAHERAHARQRHHLVLLAFGAWRRSLPWFPIATRAQDTVAVLVEMLADDQARRVVSDATLARAIARVALGHADGGSREQAHADRGPAVGQPAATLRIERLVDAPAPLARSGVTVAIVAAVALLLVPTALLIAPSLS
jgi:Zn-dependent protease with chaperone function